MEQKNHGFLLSLVFGSTPTPSPPPGGNIKKSLYRSHTEMKD
jgi:hypothetical protein